MGFVGSLLVFVDLEHLRRNDQDTHENADSRVSMADFLHQNHRGWPGTHMCPEYFRGFISMLMCEDGWFSSLQRGKP